MAYKGTFKAKNPSKYVGKADNIIYRSSWELKLMMFLDSNPNVLRWASEEIPIPYVSPVDGKIHRYYPDFWIESINTEGKKEKTLIEVKPRKETVPPDKPKTNAKGKPTPRYIKEAKTFAVNQAKWKAAKSFCLDNGWTFKIMTEVELGIK